MGTTIGETASQAEEGSGREGGSSGAPRYTRRLSDKILIAFHHACDQADFEVAEQLLHILEMMLTRRPLTPDGTRRRNMEVWWRRMSACGTCAIRTRTIPERSTVAPAPPGIRPPTPGWRRRGAASGLPGKTL